MTTLELRVPPALVVLIVGALMAALASLVKFTAVAIPGREVISIGCVAMGLLVAAAGVLSFRKHDTTVDPINPDKAQSLVTSGIYRISRNPMYLGFLLVLIGWGVYLSNLSAFLLIPAFVLYMNRFQIGPEERVLISKFGSTFHLYTSSVRRWI